MAEFVLTNSTDISFMNLSRRKCGPGVNGERKLEIEREPHCDSFTLF